MIAKRALGLPAASDSAFIISRISWFSFSAFIERITSLDNMGRTDNAALTVTAVVVLLGGTTVLVVAVVLNKYFYVFLSDIVYLEQKQSE